MFTTRTGNPLGPRNVHTLFRALITQAWVRQIRFRDMRHTCASLLLSGGMPPRMVMDIVGHSQISVTMNTYAHVMPAMQSEAAGHMDALLGNEGGHAHA
jgi:integrase